MKAVSVFGFVIGSPPNKNAFETKTSQPMSPGFAAIINGTRL